MGEHGRAQGEKRPTKSELLGRTDETEKPPPPRWVLPAIMIATLTIGGWYIIDNLAATSKMEDCTMSGRRNCVPPIDTSNMVK